MMKIRNTILIMLFVIAYPLTLSAEEWFTVRHVSDGDTIILEDDRRIRYLGINTPEIEHEDQKAEPYGNEAKAFNKSLVLSEQVRLEFDEQKYDRYDRTLAYVFLKDGTFVNAKLAAEGYAYCLYKKPNVRYTATLLKHQRKAMTAGAGLWKNWKEAANIAYIGNKSSKRFHLETCGHGKKIRKNNKIYFSKKWDAFWEGFAPCKICLKN